MSKITLKQRLAIFRAALFWPDAIKAAILFTCTNCGPVNSLLRKAIAK